MRSLSPATGIGNSPPARKLAFSPDMVMRFGSARRRASPRSSSACTRTSASTPLDSTRPMIAPKGMLPVGRPLPVAAAKLRAALVGFWKFLPTTSQLTPSSLPALREASTKRTSSITCCGERTTRSLTHFGTVLPGKPDGAWRPRRCRRPGRSGPCGRWRRRPARRRQARRGRDRRQGAAVVGKPRPRSTPTSCLPAL